MKITNLLPLAASALVITFSSQNIFASCKDIDNAAKAVNPAGLRAIAVSVVEANNGGFGLDMWVTVVDESGKVCQVLNTAIEGTEKYNNGGSHLSWLGSRVISAQKANTANAFSLDAFSISTANLYGLTQPGGSLYGLQHSNPVDASRAYAGNPSNFGTNSDPLKNKRIGGINVFGGGLALYEKIEAPNPAFSHSAKIGAIGVSGDTSCTDHAVAWNIRKALHLDNVPGGFQTGENVKGDEIKLVATVTPNTVEHPTCGGTNGAPSGLANGVMP